MTRSFFFNLILLCAVLSYTGGAFSADITITTSEAIHPDFGGVGFHVFQHLHKTNQAHIDQVLSKRWKELNPKFARVTDMWDWDRAKWDEVAERLKAMKETGTEMYMTTWNPRDTQPGAERQEYVRKVVDNLEYMVREKGFTNIKYYCMTNELSLGRWGNLVQDLPTFMDYHRELYNELARRSLDVKLLSTDASPISNWSTIEWAANNMDDISGVYGGHHYINNHTLDDLTFYNWFFEKLSWGAGIARSKGKNFIIGEFGVKQDSRRINGLYLDACRYWDTPLEKYVGIQNAESVIAALNAGVYSLGYWTFSDFPDEWNERGVNKWGIFKWSGNDYGTHDNYYAYGLLVKFFGGPATVFKAESGDGLVRVAAMQHHEKKSYSIAAVNRNTSDVPLRIRLDGTELAGAFRKYVYDPENVPQHPFGDLQEPAGKVYMKGGRLNDTIKAGTLIVYTTAYDENPPTPVKGLTIGYTPEGDRILEWQPNTEPDLCYYRIYRALKPDLMTTAKTQIGSTVATTFIFKGVEPKDKYFYKVVPVDQSGNAGEAVLVGTYVQ